MTHGVRWTLVTFLLVGAAATGAAAQSPAPITKLHGGYTTIPRAHLASYSQLYFNGQWKELEEILRTDMDALAGVVSTGAFTPRTSYTSIAFVGSQPTLKDPVIVRLLLPPAETPMGELPYRLPGVQTIYEVILTSEEASSTSVAWVSTPVANPINAEALKLAEALLTPGAQLIENAFNKARASGTVSRPDTLYALVNRVRLPHKRALLQVSTRIVDVELESSTAKANALKLSAELARTTARISPCARFVSDTLSRAINRYSAGNTLDAAERKALSESLTSIATTVVTDTSGICSLEVRPSAEPYQYKARNDAVTEAQSKFFALVNVKGDPITGATEVKNIPFRRASFGVIGGGMADKHGDTRFEVADGKIASNPVTGLVTGVVLHFHPVAYDPSAFDITPAERFSFFGGFVTTPAPGFTGGASLRLIRGLGLQASYAAMLVERLKEGFAAGQTVTTSEDPLRRGFSRSWVVGITYDFK